MSAWHTNVEIERRCPYCHPERMEAIRERESAEAPCSCHAKCKSKGCVTRVVVKAGPYCGECIKEHGIIARLYG